MTGTVLFITGKETILLSAPVNDAYYTYEIVATMIYIRGKNAFSLLIYEV